MSDVVVVGSGRMAPGIAAACAAAGARVRITARDADRARAAAGAATELSGRWVGAEPFGPATFAGATLAIETIIEDGEAKAAVLAQVERWLSDDATLATNTSSLPVDRLAAALALPERFAGLHFLHPAHATDVVEIVPGRATSDAVRQALAALVHGMGKRPIVLQRDIPGFVWNRLQFALLRECLHLIDEGIASIATIDAAVTEGLAPRWLAAGPLATADLGGLATFQRVAEELFPVLARDTAVSATLAGRARHGEGFYGWTGPERERAEARRAVVLAAAHGLVAGGAS